MKTYHADIVIVGSGLAALYTAAKLMNKKRVIILTKKKWQASNSYLAQGGIAAAYAPDDDWHQQMEDALRAGRYHNNVDETAFLARESKRQVDALIRMGMQFDRDQKGQILLAREGGHSAARVLHAHGDATGRELTGFVKKYVERQVIIHEHTQATELLVQNGHCVGVRASDQSEEPVVYYARNTVLATGGCGQIYAPTSADPAVTGDGLALAYWAGAALKDMEFVQFHPTLLIKNHRAYGLVSEAVRGEGAKLINQDGKRLLEGKHPLEDLAPRDVVSRVLFKAQKTGEAEQIYLDISMLDHFAEHFPTITQLCRQAGVDLAKGRIPVSPGAHFLMGGIETDHEGKTTLPGLYAIGECACTGVHGANRIASHSLLEAVTYAGTAAASMNTHTEQPIEKITDESGFRNVPPPPSKKEIQKTMFEYVGIWRTQQSLTTAVDWCLSWGIDFNRAERFDGTKDELERLNMLTTAWLIASSALERTESRGGHTRIDYPEEIEQWRTKSIIREVTKIEQN
ncbi:L-aspartate oxidase [Sporolactobacillus shoreicorticis]|uniref:L-aspartate oxidase n=1 Tax=Sporolactobacillus shoreicorticis TaxID=1923877 RepID=A0ABW5S2W3_9BACL|nr:L-aspartate oxidase [Sporolactobacillus shoreicorticis]MCO7127861.1 L-aspartate oxidase [Sporolactobacillus shoreicorticis]